MNTPLGLSAASESPTAPKPTLTPLTLFFAVDHCSLECVGIHAATRGTRFEVLEPIRQGMRHSFGVFGQGVATGLKLRHDHGSQFISEAYQKESKYLGIESSPAYVREPQGNGISVQR